MTIIYRNQQFCFCIKSEKGERYQDEHSMQYEQDTITIIEVNLNYRNSRLIKFAKKGFQLFPSKSSVLNLKQKIICFKTICILNYKIAVFVQ